MTTPATSTNPGEQSAPAAPAESKPASPARSEPQDEPRTPGQKFNQADVDRIIDERIGRERKRHADETAELRAQAAEVAKLRQERESDTERAVREAQQQARTEALAEIRPKLVLAEMRAAAAGRIDPDRLDDLTEDIDLGRYLTQDGAVDTERVRRKVDAWAPAQVGPGETQPSLNDPAPRKPRPDHTQGAGRSGAFGADRGLAEAERRFGKKTTTP